jgi:hypothetical protein
MTNNNNNNGQEDSGGTTLSKNVPMPAPFVISRMLIMRHYGERTIPITTPVEKVRYALEQMLTPTDTKSAASVMSDLKELRVALHDDLAITNVLTELYYKGRVKTTKTTKWNYAYVGQQVSVAVKKHFGSLNRYTMRRLEIIITAFLNSGGATEAMIPVYEVREERVLELDHKKMLTLMRIHYLRDIMKSKAEFYVGAHLNFGELCRWIRDQMKVLASQLAQIVPIEAYFDDFLRHMYVYVKFGLPTNLPFEPYVAKYVEYGNFMTPEMMDYIGSNYFNVSTAYSIDRQEDRNLREDFGPMLDALLRNELVLDITAVD